ncbi:hypothetical protein KGF57_002131 [Candida theae]|uniref:NADP-dependent oxidoreductase domain-containing protein n=1 Tax=Candida theae TaxID=1198502 RepID=A0AAD5BFM5_9ASCO|nr:uncharacterized protein KGF57_002131 [Candida theae]KAI5959355.1 hypothetical protein KGF57_002131 [Candida theae]
MCPSPKTPKTSRSSSLKGLPPFIIGGAVFNYQYHSNPNSLPVQDILRHAFELGYNAIDTSPYYGPSEEILGHALSELNVPRESYYVCTKAGRIKLDEFDYSRASVRQSVLRSLKRLQTTYLDLVYMHDIEFVSADEVIDALRELQSLQNEGVVKNIGVSGYPISFIYEVAMKWKQLEGTPLDAVMSYCHGCIQNNILFDYDSKLATDAGVDKIMNGSILSMSLLRSEPTHAFHPASPQLKAKVDDLAHQLKSDNGVELAELATKYAINEWIVKRGQSIVLGVSNLHELNVAIEAYEQLTRDGMVESDAKLIEQFQADLGEHFNESWSSGHFPN